MAYLADMRLVHRDLATRNVLVSVFIDFQISTDFHLIFIHVFDTFPHIFIYFEGLASQRQ